MSQDENIYLTMEQRKLIANSLRIKILHLLKEEPRTAKQTADILQKSPGSVHYHIKLLHEGGLLDLVKTQENGGVLEKYYQAKTAEFYMKEEYPVKGKQVGLAAAQLSLNEKSREQFVQELYEFLSRWESRIEPETGDETEVVITCLLTELENEEV